MYFASSIASSGMVDRGCDFHRIMDLQGGAMNVINAMNMQASTQNRKADIRESQVFADGGVVVKLHRCIAGVNSKKHRNFATITTPSSSSAAAEQR
jgi:hypothetical protein